MATFSSARPSIAVNTILVLRSAFRGSRKIVHACALDEPGKVIGMNPDEAADAMVRQSAPFQPIVERIPIHFAAWVAVSMG
jgi:hypothetical protein